MALQNQLSKISAQSAIGPLWVLLRISVVAVVTATTHNKIRISPRKSYPKVNQSYVIIFLYFCLAKNNHDRRKRNTSKRKRRANWADA